MRSSNLSDTIPDHLFFWCSGSRCSTIILAELFKPRSASCNTRCVTWFVSTGRELMVEPPAEEGRGSVLAHLLSQWTSRSCMRIALQRGRGWHSMLTWPRRAVAAHEPYQLGEVFLIYIYIYVSFLVAASTACRLYNGDNIQRVHVISQIPVFNDAWCM